MKTRLDRQAWHCHLQRGLLSCWLIALVWCVARGGSAQQDTPPVALTLAAAQTAAQSAAPDVLVSAARLQGSRADVGVAGMLPNPRLTTGSTTGSARLYGNLFMALPIFGQRGKAMDAADALARVAEAGVDVARIDARLAVSLAWTELWLLQQETQIAVDNAARRLRVFSAAEARFEEGAGPRLDVLRADAEAERTKAEIAALEQQRRAAAARLSAYLSQPEAPPSLHAEGEPPATERVPALAELDMVLTEHPLVRRAHAAVENSDLSLARDQRARWPLVGVQIGGNVRERHPEPTNDLQIALSAEIPIYNGALIARSQTARNITRAEMNAITIQLRAGLASALSEYAAAEGRFRAQMEHVLPATREAAELAAEAYKSGGLDLTGVLAAEQALSDARFLAVRVQADRGRLLSNLEHAVGRPL